jgi:hypothetical protein
MFTLPRSPDRILNIFREPQKNITSEAVSKIEVLEQAQMS